LIPDGSPPTGDKSDTPPHAAGEDILNVKEQRGYKRPVDLSIVFREFPRQATNHGRVNTDEKYHHGKNTRECKNRIFHQYLI
jgi:hypothetical protein